MKRISIFCLCLTAIVACKKKDDATFPVNYTGAKLVTFNNYDGYVMQSVEYADKWDTLKFEVKLGNTTGYASAPIKVTLIKDDNPVIEYNAANGTSLQTISLNGYKIIDNEVIIVGGKRIGTFRIAVNPAKTGGGSALGLSILKVEGDGALVNSDDSQNRLVIEISALNQWDGLYTSSKGYFYHPTAPRAIPAGSIKSCTTNGSNSVYTELGDFDGVNQPGAPYYVTLTIDATNKVVVSPGPGAAPGNPVTSLTGLPAGSGYTAFPGSTPSIYNNTWDPATKTFYLRYGYTNTAGVWRVIEEVLKKN